VFSSTQHTLQSFPAGTFKLRIEEGSMAYAPCTNSSIVISVIRPIFGNATLKCNSTDTYA